MEQVEVEKHTDQRTKARKLCRNGSHEPELTHPQRDSFRNRLARRDKGAWPVSALLAAAKARHARRGNKRHAAD